MAGFYRGLTLPVEPYSPIGASSDVLGRDATCCRPRARSNSNIRAGQVKPAGDEGRSCARDALLPETLWANHGRARHRWTDCTPERVLAVILPPPANGAANHESEARENVALSVLLRDPRRVCAGSMSPTEANARPQAGERRHSALGTGSTRLGCHGWPTPAAADLVC